MITTYRAALLAAAAAAVLLVSGCGDDDDDAGAGSSRGAQVEDGAAAESGGGEGASGDRPSDGQARAGSNLLQIQHLVQTAQLSVEVPDVLHAVREAERLATGSGGLVQSEHVSAHGDNEGASSADITIRVPPDVYEQTLREIAALGTLLNQAREVKDATREVVDVESRIASQRESIERVRAILSDATKLADVVTIEGELTRRQADLESLLAQQKALADQVNLATVLVTFIASEEEPSPDDDEGIGFVKGLTGGWQALMTVVALLLTVMGALLPFAAVGVPIALLVLWLLRALRRPNQPGAA